MWVTDAAGSRDETPRHDWLRHLPDHVFGYQVHGRVPWGSECERHVHFAEAELATWREQWTESWFAWQDRPENEEGVWSEQLELPITCPLYAPGFLCTPDWLPLVLLSLTGQWADVFGDYLREKARVDGVVSATLHLRAPASVGPCRTGGWAGPPRALFAEAAAPGRFGPVPESDPLYSAGTPDDGFALTMSSPEDLLAFRNLFDSDLSMFGLLSTLEMAGYLTVDVRVRKADGAVVRADQLSSGEQQILTVLGLLRLQRGQESLFLLDEPDAHFPPSGADAGIRQSRACSAMDSARSSSPPPTSPFSSRTCCGSRSGYSTRTPTDGPRRSSRRPPRAARGPAGCSPRTYAVSKANSMNTPRT